MKKGSRVNGFVRILFLLIFSVASTTAPFSNRFSLAVAQTEISYTEFQLNQYEPRDIAFGSDGNLWFTQDERDAIGRFSPLDGSVTEFPLPSGCGGNPGSCVIDNITSGPGNTLWFTETQGDYVSRITTSGEITRFAVPHYGDGPYRITQGSDGNIWFSPGLFSNALGRITPTGEITFFPLPQECNLLCNVFDLTAGPDGNIWFTEGNSSQIGKSTLSGEITMFPRVGPYDQPRSITSGPNGDLWFLTNTSIDRITTEGVFTWYPIQDIVNHLTLGADGNLWFTSWDTSSIGRITPDGDITTQVVHLPVSFSPIDMISGPDGNLWVSDSVHNRLFRINLNLDPTPTPTTPTPTDTPTPTPTATDTPTPSPTPPVTIEYFALGDSVASGHGLIDIGGACRRSGFAYPYKVADLMRDRGVKVNFAPAETHHLACTGATVQKPASKELKLSKYKWLTNQVTDALDTIEKLPPGTPVLVSITIGANDFEFGVPGKVMDRLRLPDNLYYGWADNTLSAVRGMLEVEVNRLLRQPNVSVILTEYHNPFNEVSLLFYLPAIDPYDGCIYGGCYPRTEYVIHKLNGEFLDIINSEGPGRDRLQVAAVHESFHGHASPQFICGIAPPDVNQTWVQHPSDPLSNSFPKEVPKEVVKLSGVKKWRGDCFHPNNEGSKAFAEAVNEDAIRLNR